jgi:hypothetical protein
MKPTKFHIGNGLKGFGPSWIQLRAIFRRREHPTT